MYTPKRTASYEAIVKHFAAEAYLPMLQGAIRLTIECFWACPKSHQRKRIPTPQRPKISKPDWDNVGKTISDALEGVCYQNDSQVFDAHVTCWYAAQGEPARVEVTIEELPCA